MFYFAECGQQKWYLTYISITDFTSTSSKPTTSEAECAKYANQQGWPKVFRFEAGTCYLSTLEKIPTKKHNSGTRTLQVYDKPLSTR